MKLHSLILLALILVQVAFRSALALPVVLLNEVLYDATGADAGEVFTELYGTPGLVLDGWSLTGTNGLDGVIYRSIDLSGAVIPADGILVIATSSATAELAGVTDFTAQVDWQNGPDSIQLLDSRGIVIDALQYGDAGAFNRGEGAPAVDAAPGHSLARYGEVLDTDDNRTDFLELAEPTPGLAAVPAPVPEPGALSQLLTGCILLPLLGRCSRYRNAAINTTPNSNR